MNKSVYKANLVALPDSELFLEASRDELRVLLLALAGVPADELSERAGVSPARAASALSLWLESGLLSREELVAEEFSERILPSEIDEEASVKVARDIRDSGLASLISECAGLMNKSALSTAEVKKIVALHTQYSLTEEFILTLAAHLADLGRLTATRLANEAIRLTEREVDTVEALILDIEEKKKQNDTDARMKRLFGIKNRSITKSEHKLFEKWTVEFGYSEGIIGEAYDIAVANTGEYRPNYIDKILSRWFECGCKTLAECRSRQEQDRNTIAQERGKQKPAEKKKSDPTPKYGSFNAEDALMSALMRSYGEEDKGEA